MWLIDLTAQLKIVGLHPKVYFLVLRDADELFNKVRVVFYYLTLFRISLINNYL